VRTDLLSPVMALVIDTVSERVLPCPKDIVHVPQYTHEQIGWGYVDQSIKLFVDRKVVQVTENISCLCVAFVGADDFVTGSSDCMVRLWQLSRKEGATRMRQPELLRAHSDRVVSVAACRAWSIIASGSQDGSVVIWDLNRATYVRTIWTHKENSRENNEAFCVRHVSINDSTGYIASCSSAKLCLHTVNAHPVAELDLLTLGHPESPITSLAFLEREYARQGVLATGHANGTISLRTWTARDTPSGKKAEWKLVTLRTLRCRDRTDGRTPKVTALEFVGECLYHGEEGGKVFVWDLPD